MFCKNCGSMIADDDIFCSKCGIRMNDTDVKVAGAAIADAQPIMKINKKKAVWLAVIGVVVVICLATSYLLFLYEPTLEGEYSGGMISYVFDPEGQTFIVNIDGDPLYGGTYDAKSSKITLTMDDGDKENYILYKDCIIYKDGEMTGDIPDGETFAATFENDSYTSSFGEDGKYNLLRKEDNNLTVGTYRRDGNIIHIVTDNGDDDKYVIYKDHLYNVVFFKE